MHTTRKSNMTSYANDCNMNPEEFSFLQTLPGNLHCIDCGVAKPDWGSPKLGILFCFKCSGVHRGLGTHVSFVRSVALDSWTEKQIQQMRAGGNTRCIEFLKKQGINMSTETPIREKYDTAAAELYRQVLLARVEGRPEPTEITATTAASNSQPARPTAPVVDPSRLIGFGSTPLPEPEPEVNAIGIATGATIVVGTAIIWAVSSL